MNDWGETSPIVLITGAGRGIGLRTACLFASRGARVIAHCEESSLIPDERLQEFPTVTRLVCDLRDSQGIIDMFRRISEQFGKIDVLVNNAGIFPRREFKEITEADWDLVMDVNLKAAFLCSQKAVDLMPDNFSSCIVNVASDAVRKGPRRGVHYVASKAGLIGLTTALARVLAPRRIRVNAVAPGTIQTSQPGLTDEQFDDLAKTIPLGRVGTVDDVAEAIAFLCGEGSRHITGQVLYINGGTLIG